MVDHWDCSTVDLMAFPSVDHSDSWDDSKAHQMVDWTVRLMVDR